MPKQDKSQKNNLEDYLYHNTEVLLKRYRDVVWSIEVSAVQAQINFEREMDCKLDELPKNAYSYYADGKKLKNILLPCPAALLIVAFLFNSVKGKPPKR